MTFTDVFAKSPIQPSDVEYRSVVLSSDTALFWPSAQQDTANVCARIMDVMPTVGGLSLALPPADEVGPGQDALIRNAGAQQFSVTDAAGNTIIAVPPGLVAYIYLQDNTSIAGEWQFVNFGAASSTTDAAALAGSGLTPRGATLNAAHPVVEFSANYTAQMGDRARTLVWIGGSGTLSLPSVSVAGNNWFTIVSNQGSGALTVDPSGSETIDNAASLTLNPDESCWVLCSGTEWYTVGRGRSVNFQTTLLVKDVSGNADVTLSATEAANTIQRYIGTLTADINVVVPAAVAIYYAANATTGAVHNITMKTPSGTGVTIAQGEKSIVYCDGTNVVDADTATPIAPASFSDGSAVAPSLNFASETNTGLFHETAAVGVAVQGVERFRVDATGTDTTGTVKQGGASVLTSAQQLALAHFYAN